MTTFCPDCGNQLIWSGHCPCRDGKELDALNRPTVTPTDGDAERAFNIICERLAGYQTAKDIVAKALQTRTPPVPVDTIAVPKEVLQGVREAASKCIDDLIGTLLCHPDNRLSHKEATAYVHRLYGKALASLDAVLAEGE